MIFDSWLLMQGEVRNRQYVEIASEMDAVSERGHRPCNNDAIFHLNRYCVTFMLFIWQRTHVTERGQWIHVHTHTQYTRRVCSIHAQDETSGRVVSFLLTLFTWIK